MASPKVVDPASITAEEVYWLTYPYLYYPGRLTQFAQDLQHGAQEIEAVLTQQPSQLLTIQQNLHRVTCPVLVLWGDRDRWFPVQDGETLHARLPNAEFQVIPNCGYNIGGGNVDAANQAMVDFLRRGQLVSLKMP
jgi:pimeloyl-ACP methyl ester carboxylesterase